MNRVAGGGRRKVHVVDLVLRERRAAAVERERSPDRRRGRLARRGQFDRLGRRHHAILPHRWRTRDRLRCCRRQPGCCARNAAAHPCATELLGLRKSLVERVARRRPVISSLARRLRAQPPASRAARTPRPPRCVAAALRASRLRLTWAERSLALAVFALDPRRRVSICSGFAVGLADSAGSEDAVLGAGLQVQGKALVAGMRGRRQPIIPATPPAAPNFAHKVAMDRPPPPPRCPRNATRGTDSAPVPVASGEPDKRLSTTQSKAKKGQRFQWAFLLNPAKSLAIVGQEGDRPRVSAGKTAAVSGPP